MSNSSLAAHSQAGKEEDAVNDITYVGKLTMNYSVSRHAHESWEFVYCTYGSGAFSFDSGTLEYQEGDVVIIPPMVPHSNGSEDGFQNIHINMVSPSLSYASPRVVSDDSNHFLLDAFSAAYFQFYSDRKEAAALLSLYGDLICCYYTGTETSPEELKRYASTWLPEYMIPEYFIHLDTMPRNDRGKFDYPTLKAMEITTREAKYEPPKTDLEKKI